LGFDPVFIASEIMASYSAEAPGAFTPYRRSSVVSIPIIAVGCDCSKGRIDVEIRNHHGTVLHSDAYDETPAEHRRFAEVFTDLGERFPNARFLVGIESTGGLERNWLKFFRYQKYMFADFRVLQLNAQTVHAYRTVKLHRAPGDAAAASDIAGYLLAHCEKKVSQPEQESGPIVCYRLIRSLREEEVAYRIRLKGLMVSVHPDLVRFCRSGDLPQWLCALLEKHPTAAALARARVDTVDAIPHITTDRAKELIANAKESVASLTDAASMLTIRMLIRHITQLNEEIAKAQEELLKLIQSRTDSPLSKNVALLESFPGIGSWSAVCLACELGDVTRFANEKAVIAWSGLDPVIEISGDGCHQRGISHRGNGYVRGLLFPLAMSAVRHNPSLKAFYEKLLQRGKPKRLALVAVMAKILRIAFAILRTGKPYNEKHEETRCNQAKEQQKARSIPPQSPLKATPSGLNAPITRKEVQRRKKAAMAKPQARDQSPKNGIDHGTPKAVSTPNNLSKG
jgi:transposase